MDFDLSARSEQWRSKLQAFFEKEVLPRHRAWLEHVAGKGETAPFMGERGPFPEDLYRFEVLAHFNQVWQPDHVLRATHGGRALRGPGMTRGAVGQPTFFLREEIRL